jgi:hypothetical protein
MTLFAALRGGRDDGAYGDLEPPPSDGDIWFMVRVLRRCQARDPAAVPGAARRGPAGHETIRAAGHELRCAECRVTWWSWLLRLARAGGMSPQAGDWLRRGSPPAGESPAGRPR